MLTDWAHRVHAFWYGEQDVFDDDYEHLFARWYRGGPAFDADVRQQFEPLLNRAVADHHQGVFAPWLTNIRARHSVVLLLDQLSRNMFRGSARMFACDSIAIEIVHRCLTEDSYDNLAPVEKLFMAVALEHSERLEDVELSAALMNNIAASSPKPQRRRFTNMCRYNADHLGVVRQFGRYPHRNDLLGRQSTPEELRFLATTSFRWMRSVNAEN